MEEYACIRRDVLRENTRKEFESARFESNPEVIARLLVVGRNCLNETEVKMETKLHQMLKDEETKKIS